MWASGFGRCERNASDSVRNPLIHTQTPNPNRSETTSPYEPLMYEGKVTESVRKTQTQTPISEPKPETHPDRDPRPKPRHKPRPKPKPRTRNPNPTPKPQT
jgi:hypothetical protein